jgi:hypothetical protein
VGPARQPHGPNNGAAVPTAFGPRPLPYLPIASPAALAHRPAHRFRRPRPPPRAAFKRSNPPPCGAPLSSSSARCRHYAIVLPSLSCQKMPPIPLQTSRHRPELRTDAGSSPDLLAGALSCSSTPPPLFLSNRTEPPRTAYPNPPPTISTPPQAPCRQVLPPNRSDPAGDPYSGLPPSLPHH